MCLPHSEGRWRCSPGKGQHGSFWESGAQCLWHCAFESRFESFHLFVSLHVCNESTEENVIVQMMVQEQ